MWGRLRSLILLAWGVLATLSRRLVPGRSSLLRFADHYQGEGILATTPTETELLSTTGRCTACGICEQVVSVTPEGTVPSVMRFVLAGTRSLPDYDAAGGMLSGLSEDQLERAQAICPRSVPIIAWTQLVREHAGRRQGVTPTVDYSETN